MLFLEFAYRGSVSESRGHGKFLTGIDIKRDDPLPNILEQPCCSAVIDLSGDVTACVLISRLSIVI